MKNLDLVKAWLQIATAPPAAVYFDDYHKPWVYHRHGSIIPLLASTFADDLSECLVYIDESHTRGTDLKLPPKARGALTLALGQTKDLAVQGLSLIPGNFSIRLSDTFYSCHAITSIRYNPISSVCSSPGGRSKHCLTSVQESR